MTLDELGLSVLNSYCGVLVDYWKDPRSVDYWKDPRSSLPPLSPTIATMDGDQLEMIQLPLAMCELLDTPSGKGVVFEALRRMRRDLKPEAIAFAHDAWAGVSTDAGAALGGEFLRLANLHGSEWMFKRGYMSRREVAVVHAQDGARVIIRSRPYAHKGGEHWTWYPDEIREFRQADVEKQRLNLW
jgi:hypothetical protein